MYIYFTYFGDLLFPFKCFYHICILCSIATKLKYLTWGVCMHKDCMNKILEDSNIKENIIKHLNGAGCNVYKNIIFNETEKDDAKKHLSLIKSKENKIAKEVVTRISQNVEKNIIEHNIKNKKNDLNNGLNIDKSEKIIGDISVVLINH